jgi:hypothetical protein
MALSMRTGLDLYLQEDASIRLSILLVFAVYLIYLITVSLQRLYFSPLAKFPGPKLAALTEFYEQYYNIWLDGQFTFHINKLHDKYGEDINTFLD